MTASNTREIAPTKLSLNHSISACIDNGDKLLDDIDMLQVQEPLSRQVALAIIAQEEFAKAFLLVLVRDEIVPWSQYLLRAMNDHACKQLVGVLIEYVDFRWETVDELQAHYDYEYSMGDGVPHKVADAMDILRHEKIGRWESKNWEWSEPPSYDPSIQRIAKGRRDQVKQDALYVRIGRDGGVISNPTKITSVVANEEIERAKRYASFLRSLFTESKNASITYSKVRKFLSAIFETKK
jgi:AbiV family abortive infection protein